VDVCTGTADVALAAVAGNHKVTAIIRDKARAKKEEEKRVREEAEKLKREREAQGGGRMQMTPEMMQRFGGMRGAGQRRPGMQPQGQQAQPTQQVIKN